MSHLITPPVSPSGLVSASGDPIPSSEPSPAAEPKQVLVVRLRARKLSESWQAYWNTCDLAEKLTICLHSHYQQKTLRESIEQDMKDETVIPVEAIINVIAGAFTPEKPPVLPADASAEEVSDGDL
jgi:hypothetical protein